MSYSRVLSCKLYLWSQINLIKLTKHRNYFSLSSKKSFKFYCGKLPRNMGLPCKHCMLEEFYIYINNIIVLVIVIMPWSWSSLLLSLFPIFLILTFLLLVFHHLCVLLANIPAYVIHTKSLYELKTWYRHFRRNSLRMLTHFLQVGNAMEFSFLILSISSFILLEKEDRQ